MLHKPPDCKQMFLEGRARAAPLVVTKLDHGPEDAA
jgi:hypothetical protein